MPIDVQMPDGTIISGVPDNVTQADLLKRYQAFKPAETSGNLTGAVPDELGRYDVAKQPTELQPVTRGQKPEDIGFLERNIAAGKRGIESLSDVTGGLGLAGTAITGTPEETAVKMREIKREQAKPQETPGLTAADIERIYKEKGLGAAISQVPSFISESILASAPQMAIPLAAGAAASPFVTPIGGALVGIGTYGIQQFGNFLTRQAVEKNNPQELELTKAALTAGATAPLGYFADRFTAGLGGMSAKKAGSEILKELSARQVAAKVGKRAAVGAAEGIIAEAPLEVLEQAAERYQAGLSLTGDDANNEYKEAFFGAAGAGAGIGGVSRGIQAYQTPVKTGEKPPEEPTEEQQMARWNELNAITKGTEDQFTTDENGNKVKIPGVLPRYFTPEEQKEYQTLKTKFGQPAETPENKPAESAEPSKVETTAATTQPTKIDPEIQAGMAAVNNLSVFLQNAQNSYNAAISLPNENYRKQNLNKIKTFLNSQLSNFLTPEESKEYVNYLIDDGGIAGEDLGTNHGLFGEAVKNFYGKPSETTQAAPTATPAAVTPSAPEPTAPTQAAPTPTEVVKAPPVEAAVEPEPVAEPEKITAPASEWNTVETGKPVTIDMYQGRGEDKSKIYNGAQIPVAGDGQYFAPTGADAAKYGEVKKHKVTLNNPLVITNDAQWRDLTKNKAGWRFPNPFGLSEEETNKAAQSLKNVITGEGYDSLVIKPSGQGDDAKVLWNVFGHDQVIDYKQPSAPAEKAPAAPVEPAEKAPAAPKKPSKVKATKQTTSEPKSFQIKKPLDQIAAEIDGIENGSELAKYLIDNAPNSAAKAIAERVYENIKALEKSGVPVKVEILKGRNRNGYYGSSTSVAVNGQVQYYKVELNGLDSQGRVDDGMFSGKPTGTRYSTMLHELLHVLSQVQIKTLMKRNFRGPEKVIYNELRSVFRAVKNQIEEDKKNLPRDQWHPLLEQVGRYNDGSILKDLDELFVRSLSEADVQSYLSTIKMGKKTALTKLMEIFRKLIGLSPEYQTALDKILSVTEKVFAQTPEDMQRLAKEGHAISTKRREEVGNTSNPAEGRNYKGEPVKALWSFPEDQIKHWHGLSDEQIDDLIYKLQDKQIDTKRIQQLIEQQVGKIDENLDVYEKEQLYHGRTATGIREYLLNELLPAIKETKRLGLTPQEIKEYLHMRHAKERNDKMNELNRLDPVTGEERKTPWELQDRASGISTAKAKEYMDNLDPAKKSALEKMAEKFDAMVKETQRILVESGAEEQSTIDAWNDTYDFYVPLFRIEEDFAKTGGMGATGASKGFGTRGSFSKRAMGSEKEVQDILGNLIAQRERALIRAEKMRVGHALFGLALNNPNPDLWLPVNPDAIKSREALIKELQGMGYDNAESIADSLMEEPKTRYISKERKVFIDPNTGLPTQETQESVKLKVDNLKRYGENVFSVRINGKDRYIFFNQNNPQALRMVQSLMNLDADSLGQIEGMLGRATRWFASVNTQYNPIFGAVNLIRDVGGAMFNLTTTALAGKQGQVSRGVFPAMRGIMKVLRDERAGNAIDLESDKYKDDKWAKAFVQFRREGGQTGYRDSLIRTDEERQIYEQELEKLKPGPNAKKAFRSVLGALSDFNDMMENSVRLSAYEAAVKPKSDGGLGLSPQKAAILAKNLTVNFDKKGQLSQRINAYYAFFNASMQGTARLAQTLKGPMGKKIIAGGIGLGTMQAVLLAMAGFRDDEPPEFVKERNFIIPTPGGKYLSIPYPLGLHILPNIGRITTEFVLSGGKNPGKKVANLAGSFMDAFSPVGSSGLSIQSVLPTVLDPIAALESNKDAFGRPIYKEDRATNPTPGYMRSRESASEISKQLSYFLNLASGGGKYSKGFLSPTADELDYIAGQVTGGAGRELMKVEQAVKAGITGEELPAYRVPLAGRFYGETESKAAESSRFYNNITRMADYENEIKGRIKNKENVGEYLREHPQARYWQMANTVENQINALNKQKKEFIDRGLPKERIQRIENQKAVLMKRFNDHIAKFEE